MGSQQREDGSLLKFSSNAGSFSEYSRNNRLPEGGLGLHGIARSEDSAYLLLLGVKHSVQLGGRRCTAGTPEVGGGQVYLMFKRKKPFFISYLGKHGIELLPRAIVTPLGEKELHLFFHLFFIQVPTVLVIDAGPRCGVRGACEEWGCCNECFGFPCHIFSFVELCEHIDADNQCFGNCVGLEKCKTHSSFRLTEVTVAAF